MLVTILGVQPVLNELPEFAVSDEKLKLVASLRGFSVPLLKVLLYATKNQPLITPTVNSLFTGSVRSV